MSFSMVIPVVMISRTAVRNAKSARGKSRRSRGRAVRPAGGGRHQAKGVCGELVLSKGGLVVFV